MVTRKQCHTGHPTRSQGHVRIAYSLSVLKRSAYKRMGTVEHG